MRGGNETLPAAFSLLKSEFSDFLCAPIGDEENHASLTLLSALSRQGIDPWQEAARLSRLPRDSATQGLAAMIAALPGGLWPRPAATVIAARLVDLLPRPVADRTDPDEAASRRHPIIPTIVPWSTLFIVKALFYGGVIAMMIFLAMR